ncbi:hypothetical protein GPECTOR_54g206 [Gonium pectorale]|uniref:VHS domain-containing protein n=1 Tax=Gonium pectorale TaxID=33097 RepID=A0A150G7E3_GONPE|nr:hypothetical protein GPECTOR_54g206 [Gonium pectorale]|eukprot:KXZ45465.1 hypothetical protein GPECTOR_54g206 [Gonium pectorale]
MPLLGLTVLHTMSLNSSTIVRNQMAAPRLFQRLEKQLAKPQGPQVATAIVQVLVDWAHLFGSEELGARSRAALAQPRIAGMALGCNPSPAVLCMEEEMRLGIPPVAPIRGEDFIRAMYNGAGGDLSRLSGGLNGGSGTPRVQPGSLPGGAPPAITTHAVPLLCSRMKADAQRLTAALAACRAAARSGRQGELMGAMDGAYREAERCSQWRRRVQDFTQQDDNPAALSSVLSATDVINTALREWQDFASIEVYHLMRITVPPMSAAALRASTQSRPAAGTGGGPRGRTTDVADLLNIGGAAAGPSAAAASHLPHSQSASQIGGAFDPFGDPPQRATPGASAGSNHGSFRGGAGGSGVGTAAALPPAQPGPSTNPFANPFAPGAQGVTMFPVPVPPSGAPSGAASARSSAPTIGATQPPGRPAHQAQPSLSDWDPFKSTGLPPAVLTAPSSGPSDWTVFDGDGAASSVGGSHSAPYSPGLGSTMPSGALPSPSPSHSGLSVSSTPNGAGGSGGGGASPRSIAGTPHQPATGPLPPAAASGFSSSPQLGNGLGARPQGSSASVTATAAGPGDRTGTGGLSRSTTVPTPASASTTAPARPPASGGAAGSSSGFDWRPEFDRLAAELRAMAPPASSSAAAGPPLADVLARVRGLCEELAAKHGRCVAELTQRHAEELRDVKSRSLAKLREVTSAGQGAALGGLGNALGSGPLSGVDGGSGGGGNGGTSGTAAGPRAATSGLGMVSGRPTSAGAAVQGPLSLGLQAHQHQHGPSHLQPQQYKPNGLAAATPPAHGNGRAPAADFSLI